MVKRVLTVVVGLPIVILLVHLGGLALTFFVGLAAIMGLKELYTALEGKHKHIHWIGYVFAIIYFTALFLCSTGYAVLFVFAGFIITVQLCLVFFYGRLTLDESVKTVYGFMYIPLLLAFVLLVRLHEFGAVFVWLIFTSSFGCDTFAYMFGVNFGKRKLTNTPSPNKSVEGLFGGVFGAAFVGGLYAFCIYQFTEQVQLSFIPIAIITCAVAAVFCIFGDMAASAIKRQTGIKDFGNVFPGHGGVLDRIDSIMLAAPVIFASLILVTRLGLI